jgi:hypothetical protein
VSVVAIHAAPFLDKVGPDNSGAPGHLFHQRQRRLGGRPLEIGKAEPKAR